MTDLSVARDFSQFPFGRYPSHGPNNGERFRDELLIPALNRGSVCVDLAGARGLAPSFMEESFGGLRRKGFSLAQLEERLTIICETDPSRVAEAWAYIRQADGEEAVH